MRGEAERKKAHGGKTVVQRQRMKHPAHGHSVAHTQLTTRTLAIVQSAGNDTSGK